MTKSAGQPLKAAAWMIGTVISFSTMAVAGREAGAELDTFEIIACRSIAGLIIVAAFAAAAGTLRDLRGGAFGLHLIRNSLHFGATNLWLFAVTAIPLAQVFAFEFTAPLWTAVLAPLLLREVLPKARIAATLAGFAGLLLVARPGFVQFSPGMAAAAFCAVGFAGAAIATRRLVAVQSVTGILFWMCAIQSVFSIFCASIDLEITLPSSRSLLPVALITVCGLSAHLCLAKALRIAPATLVMPLDFARLPVIAVAGLLLYGEAIDAFMIVGAVLILGANYVNVRIAGANSG